MHSLFRSLTVGLVCRTARAPEPRREAILMRPERLSPVHLLFIVSLSTVMFSARLTWAQEMSPASNTPAHVLVLAPPSVSVPEAGIRFNPAYEQLLLPFGSNQASSLFRFRPFDLGCLFAPAKNGLSTGLWQFTKMDEPRVTAYRLMGNAPTEWLTSHILQTPAHYRERDGGEALQYYSHRIPWAGRMMLGAGRQAAFHPRALRVFELIKPGLSFGTTAYPRWLHR